MVSTRDICTIILVQEEDLLGRDTTLFNSNVIVRRDLYWFDEEFSFSCCSTYVKLHVVFRIVENSANMKLQSGLNMESWREYVH